MNPMCAEQSHGHIPTLLYSFLSLPSLPASSSFWLLRVLQGPPGEGDGEKLSEEVAMSHPPKCWPALQEAWTRLYALIYVT